MNLILLNAGGIAVPASDADGVIVHDATTALMWSADRISPKELKHAAALKAAKASSLGGFDDWRVPTIRERLSIVDYDRHAPALDTGFFKPCSGWEWTSSPAAWAPGDGVWVVGSGYGGAGSLLRNDTAWLRVVRSVSSPVSGQ